jgi:hypothetical protein
MTWWLWLVIAWSVLTVAVVVPLGSAMRAAGRRRGWAADPTKPIRLGSAPPMAATPDSRRRVPAPPIAVLLVGTGLSLEVLGFVLRTAGADRAGAARLLSMDEPLSVPRMFIAVLVAAFAGASRARERRAWWTGVGLVAVLAAQVGGGTSLHVHVLKTLGLADDQLVVTAGSTVLGAAVLGSLWWVSRNERRDRRRVLAAIAFYGVAAGALSALSTVVAQEAGTASVWAAVATLATESARVLGAVAVLMAVLVGVAPRLVLPAEWSMRRAADAQTIDAPGVVRGMFPDAHRPRG